LKTDRKHISHEELLRRFYSSRDIAWVGILLERFTVLLFGVCMKYLRDPDQAKDAVQQVFLKALSEIPKTEINNIGGWLYTVAKNECLGVLRGRKPLVDETQLQELGQEADQPIEELLRQSRQAEALREAMEGLKSDQKDCIRLFYFERNSYQQIADVMHYSVKQVKSHIQNGKRNLRIALEDTPPHYLKGDRHEHST
jgi:RNA polymerase sigma-70 factor (ECF subfamily)